VEEKQLLTAIKDTVKKYLRWYSYPLIYFLVTSLVCAYTWYHRPEKYRAGITLVFKTISVIPALIWTGAITIWIAAAIALMFISYALKKKYSEHSIWSWADRISQRSKDSIQKTPKSLWRKTVHVAIYCIGIILIVTGISLAIWISRPYITLLLSTSKIEALENKAKLGQVQGNRIIVPSVLVDAPIIEGISQEQLSRGVCHITQSPSPGEGGNCIIEGHNLAQFGLWKPQSFFSMLEVANKGTPIYVFYNGKRYIYTVKEKIFKDVNDPKLFDFTPGERLTLITCVSTWSPTIYTNRRTVIVAYPELI
jgi:LPXTG-site transpeptidase (sortase) family protein